MQKCYQYDDMEEDFIRLLLKGDESFRESLWMQSMSAVIGTEDRTSLPVPERVKERFQCEAGDMLIFKIENGFYTVSSDGK